MKRILLLVLLLIIVGSPRIYGQENSGILNAPVTWQHEIIPFPLGFAPTIDFVGFEDLRFSPGWADSSSREFWTYSFAWYIDKDSVMTDSKLAAYFKLYYDGLMGVDLPHGADSAKITRPEKTRCTFVKYTNGFSGEMRVYDAFFKKDYMTLNIKVKEYICPTLNKQIILCNISPKPFNHGVWEIFNDVRIKVACE